MRRKSGSPNGFCTGRAATGRVVEVEDEVAVAAGASRSGADGRAPSRSSQGRGVLHQARIRNRYVRPSTYTAIGQCTTCGAPRVGSGCRLFVDDQAARPHGARSGPREEPRGCRSTRSALPRPPTPDAAFAASPAARLRRQSSGTFSSQAIMGYNTNKGTFSCILFLATRSSFRNGRIWYVSGPEVKRAAPSAQRRRSGQVGSLIPGLISKLSGALQINGPPTGTVAVAPRAAGSITFHCRGNIHFWKCGPSRTGSMSAGRDCVFPVRLASRRRATRKTQRCAQRRLERRVQCTRRLRRRGSAPTGRPSSFSSASTPMRSVSRTSRGTVLPLHLAASASAESSSSRHGTGTPTQR